MSIRKHFRCAYCFFWNSTSVAKISLEYMVPVYNGLVEGPPCKPFDASTVLGRGIVLPDLGREWRCAYSWSISVLSVQ